MPQRKTKTAKPRNQLWTAIITGKHKGIRRKLSLDLGPCQSRPKAAARATRRAMDDLHMSNVEIISLESRPA